MKHQLNVTALVVTVLFCGLCGTVQAQSTTFTFDGIAPVNSNVAIPTPLVRNGYTMTLTAGSGGILDRTWSPDSGVTDFTGGVCGGFSLGLVVSFTRDNGQPFAATSVAIGSLLTAYQTATWTVTGHFASGGSEQIILQGVHSTKTTTNFPAYFRNLTNLVFTGVGGAATSGPPAERPAFDELVLVDAPAPSPRVVMDFNGAAGAPGATYASFAADATYRQYGYTMQNAGGTTMWFSDNDQSPYLNAFEDDVVQFAGHAPSAVRVVRDDGQPFVANSLVTGGQVNGSLVLTGNRVAGGTATLTLATQAGANTTVTLPDSFANILSLDIACNSSAAALDDLTLELYVPRSTLLSVR